LRDETLTLMTRFLEQLQTGPSPAWLDLNLTMAQLKMLAVVDWLGPAPMSSFAARLGIGFSAATSLIDRLEEQALVRRQHDLRDRRVVRVEATQAGHAVMGGLRSANADRLRRIVEKIDTTELAGCISAFEAINDAVRLESSPQQPLPASSELRGRHEEVL
jgi:DNA-binding MarR family transcriptional regulator